MTTSPMTAPLATSSSSEGSRPSGVFAERSPVTGMDWESETLSRPACGSGETGIGSGAGSSVLPADGGAAVLGAIIAPPWTERTEQTASIQNTRQIKPVRATGRARLLFTPPSPAPGAQLSTPVCDIGFVNVGIINFGLPTILLRPPHRIDNASGVRWLTFPFFQANRTRVFSLKESARTTNPVRTRGIFGVKQGFAEGLLTGESPS